MILGLINVALQAATEGLKLANTKAAREHIDKKTEMLLKLQKLEEHPYAEQDDAEIVSMYKEAKLWIERVSAEIMAMEALKK